MLLKFPLCYNIDGFLYAVEDIAFSAFLQQQSILTYNYVPPCPRDDLEMFGIIPHKVLEYGVDMDVAVYCQSSSDKLFSQAVHDFCSEHNLQILAGYRTNASTIIYFKVKSSS